MLKIELYNSTANMIESLEKHMKLCYNDYNATIGIILIFQEARLWVSK